MLSFIIVLAAAIRISRADNITVVDPTNAVQCLPLVLSWSGGTPPYSVDITSHGYDDLFPMLKAFNDINDTTVTWYQTQGFTGPVQITLGVSDSTGQQTISNVETLAVGDVAVDDGGACLNNATLSATDSYTTGKPYRTSTPGAPQSDFTPITIIPTGAGAAPTSGNIGAAMAEKTISLGAVIAASLFAVLAVS
ncbi:hypothetical protein B0H19DRAFT_1115160 [Mycena capillaripes]|nr:hypothetical protein B0H19DRAFT_1115160 [Mycena capillaripes]